MEAVCDGHVQASAFFAALSDPGTAVSHLTSIWRASSRLAMSVLADVIKWMARNHFVSGVVDLWKIVPARTEACTRQARHLNTRRGLQYACNRLRHLGQTKPSGQRIVTSASWQCSPVSWRL